MSEIQYKFKSSLNFEKISLSESFITVGELKERINKKQSIKTNGFDLKFKNNEGRVYSGDSEIIDAKYKIIVSRCPKVVKPSVNVRKKDSIIANKLNDEVNSTNDVVVQINNQDKEIKNVDSSVGIESLIIPPSDDIIIPDYLKCLLCKNIMKDAMMITCCKKNFCYDCITGYLFDPDISGSMECPDCKSTVSNCGSTLIENLKLRKLVSKYQDGTLDTTSHDLCTENDDSIIQEDNTNVIEEEVITFFNSEDNHQEEILIDDLTNLYEENLIDQLSTEIEISQPRDIFECQMESHSPEEPLLDAAIESKVLPHNEVNKLDEVIEKPNVVEPNVIEQHATKPSSQKKASSRSDQIITDTTNNTKSTGIQSIKDLDFDPVLYMKFLKIVGESYPEELKQILSNNLEKTHKKKYSEERSSSSKTQQRSRDDEYYDNKPPPQKKYRKENVLENNEDNKYKKTYDNSNNRKREAHLDNRGYYDEGGHRRGGLEISSQSREQYPRNPNEISEIKSNRLMREMDPPRLPKDYYPQHNSSRYNIRSQFENQVPQFYEDRRRFKPDHCSTSYQTDKSKYNRRSDR